MKICITILILITSIAVFSFEHAVVRGDSLWALSQHYLGSAMQWKHITYLDSSQPFARKLSVGRFVTDMVQQNENITALSSHSISSPVQGSVMKKSPVTSVFTPRTTTSLSFNTRFYCCAADVVSMDEHGKFQITPQTHPFLTAIDQPVKQKMMSFMNINISQELLDAFNNN